MTFMIGGARKIMTVRRFVMLSSKRRKLSVEVYRAEKARADG